MKKGERRTKVKNRKLVLSASTTIIILVSLFAIRIPSTKAQPINVDAIAVWSHDTGSPADLYDIYYSIYDALLNTWWSLGPNPTDVIPIPFGNDFWPAISFDHLGTAMVVWSHDLGPPMGFDIYYSRWLGPATGWTPPNAINHLPDNDLDPAIALWEDGTGIAIWIHYTGVAFEMWYSQWNGVIWSPGAPIVIPWPPGLDVMRKQPEIAYDANHNAVVVWTDGPTLGPWHVYRSILFNGAASWSPPTDLDSTQPDGVAVEFRKGISPDTLGNAKAVWNHESALFDNQYSIWDGTNFSPAAPIFLGSRGLGTAIAFDPANRATAIYSTSGSLGEIWSNREVGGIWQAPQLVSSPNFQGHEPRIVHLSNGVAVAVWAGTGPGMPDDNIIYNIWNPTSGTWSTSALVDPAGPLGDDAPWYGPVSIASSSGSPMCPLGVFMPDWPVFRHDPGHSGYSPMSAPNKNATLWNYTTGSYVYSSPAVIDDRVFVGSYDNKIYALNASTGAHLWNYTTGFVVYSSPAVAEGRVFVGSRNGMIYALNASTGVHLWNHTTGGAIWSSPVVGDGKVFIGSEDRRVYALNATTGALIWSYLTGERVNSSPAVADGKVYVGSYDKNVYALNATNGALIWSYQTGAVIFSSPAVVDGRVYIGSRDNNIYALNATTGAYLWSYTTGDDVESSPAVAYGMVFVGSRDGGLYALNATTGAPIWNKATGGVVNSSPAVADGKVFVGSHNNEVYAFNATTGSVIWSYTTAGLVESSPAVAYEKVYIGSSDGKVYAFGYKHDIAITKVVLPKTIVGQGFSIDINITIQNQGNVRETFNVTAYYDNNPIETLGMYMWDPEQSYTIPLKWNTSGVAKGNYTISAYVWPVPGETDTTDNTHTDGWIIVAMIGDISSPLKPGVPDGKVDMADVGAVAKLFGVAYPDPRYNANYDITGPIVGVPDGKIDMMDIGTVARRFGQVDP